MRHFVVALVLWSLCLFAPVATLGRGLVESPLVKVENHFSVVENGKTVTGTGMGTGFFVNEKGLIVTAAHVLRGCKDLYVYTSEAPGTPKKASIVLSDTDADLALIRVRGVKSAPFRFCAYLDSGQRVSAHAWRYELPERTVGIVIGPRDIGGMWIAKMLATYGFSGGPVINDQAQCVVGVTKAIFGDVLSPGTVFVRIIASDKVMEELRKLAPEAVVGL